MIREKKTFLFNLLLCLQSVLFVSLFLILSYYNRLARDDYFFLYKLKELGIWKSIAYFYHHWSPRSAKMLFINTLLSFSDQLNILFVFGVLTISFLIIISFTWLRYFLIHYAKSTVPALPILNYGVLFTCLFFFSSFSISETWFWLCSSAIYLWSIMFFCLGWYAIITPFNGSRFIIVISFIYIGGSSEPFAFTVLTGIVGYLCYRVHQLKLPFGLFMQNPVNTKLFIAFIVCAGMFLAMYSSSGTQFRSSLLHQSSWTATGYVAAKGLVKILLLKLPQRIPYLLLFSIPWLFLGHQLAPEKKSISSITEVLPFLRKVLIVLVCLMFLNIVPMAFIMSELGPDRALAPISFMMAVFFAFLGFYLGYNLNFNPVIVSILYRTSVVAGVLVLLFSLYNQFSTVRSYSSALDERINYLKVLNKEGNRNVIELPPLPHSGQLPSAEIFPDTLNDVNKHFRLGLGLNYNIKSRTEP